MPPASTFRSSLTSALASASRTGANSRPTISTAKATPTNMDTEPSNRRSILFVDDDAEFLKMIERVMSLWSHDKWKVLTATSASAAMALLQNEVPSLIVID